MTVDFDAIGIPSSVQCTSVSLKLMLMLEIVRVEAKGNIPRGEILVKRKKA